MHFPTFLQTLVLGVLGSILLGGLFNIPDGGAVVAIAFVGSIIVNLLMEKKRLKMKKKAVVLRLLVCYNKKITMFKE